MSKLAAPLEEGCSGAALAQLQCASGAVLVVYSGLGGGASNQAPWFAYHGAYPSRWQPVFEESYIEGTNLTIQARAPSGYPGPFSAISSSSAVFVGNDDVANPTAVALELATNDGATLAALGSVTGITAATGAAFLSSRLGWVVGERGTGTRSDETGPVCPWVIDATTDGGQTWVTQKIYAP